MLRLESPERDRCVITPNCRGIQPTLQQKVAHCRSRLADVISPPPPLTAEVRTRSNVFGNHPGTGHGTLNTNGNLTTVLLVLVFLALLLQIYPLTLL